MLKFEFHNMHLFTYFFNPAKHITTGRIKDQTFLLLTFLMILQVNDKNSFWMECEGRQWTKKGVWVSRECWSEAARGLLASEISRFQIGGSSAAGYVAAHWPPLVTTSDPFLLAVWGPPLQWSGAHVSAGSKLPAASTLRRRPTPGAVYLVRPPWHPAPTAPRKWPHMWRCRRWCRHTCSPSWAWAKWGISCLLRKHGKLIGSN